MPTCMSCASEYPEGSRFCPSCGVSLAGPAETAVERRVVTTLFADLVGFTALCEKVDTEDVDRVLWAYYDMARGIIERFGGVVEKFIGDAVVGVFGIPLAHEDDPERAVRAALTIVEGMGTLPTLVGRGLRVRVGVNTGRALVRMHITPSSGEGFLAGDTVNTAARLLSVAPPMGVVVGETTRRLTSRVIAYQSLGPIHVKGKARPIQRWLAGITLSRRGVDLRTPLPVPMVGREVEFGILNGLFERARASSIPQFALLVGEAGLGKSRLLLELARHLDRTPGLLLTWRQGRCPAYGDGLAFWALSEIVKAHCGILESDQPSEAEAKLVRAPGIDRQDEWMADRLRPLIGLPGPQTSHDENFVAWLRFLEGVARARPTVLVFEDLQWASESTLEFLDYLWRHASSVPLLVLAATRPELLTAHPDFATSAEAARRIELKSLSAEEAGRLVAGLAGAGASLAVRSLVLERCGGNPLYAEELLRFFEERPDIAQREGSRTPSADVLAALPGSLQTLIAARLDVLRPEHKAVLADAAVVGQVFWPGVVSELGDRGAGDVDRILRELATRELVRLHSDSSVEGEDEFAFWHALTREVTYDQLPRAVRATKHAAVARWLEATAGKRVGDLAEILAYHYVTALEVATSAEQRELAGELVEPTIRALVLAGDRALALDVARAERHYAQAVELTADGAPERSYRLLSWAESLIQGGDLEQASQRLETAIAALRDAGASRTEAVALSRLGDILWLQMDARCESVCREAMLLLEADAPSPEKAQVHADWAAWCAKNYLGAKAVAAADEALSLHDQLGLPESARALGWRGMARCDMGDPEGLDDLRRAIHVAETQGSWRECGALYANYADEVFAYQGPRAALQCRREGLAIARQRGDLLAVEFLRTGSIEDLASLGEWSAALDLAVELEAVFEHRRRSKDLVYLRVSRALILTHKGALVEAESLVTWCDEQASVDPDERIIVLSARAALHLARGDDDAAFTALRDLDAERRRLACYPQFGMWITGAVLTAAAAGHPDLAVRLAEGHKPERMLDELTAKALQACLLEARHERAAASAAHADAARGWREFGAVYEEALAYVWQSRCLLEDDGALEAYAILRRAREILARLGARPALAEVDALLIRASGSRRQAARD